jgi:hypothetical protein
MQQTKPDFSWRDKLGERKEGASNPNQDCRVFSLFSSSIE